MSSQHPHHGELDKVKRDRDVEIETLKEELRMLREDNKRLMESKAAVSQHRDRTTNDRAAPPPPSSWLSTNTNAPSCSHVVPNMPTSPAANEEEYDCYREHVRKVRDAKDREIILLETELRKVRLEKDKQILELKEEIKKLETMKRSEIAASKRDMQMLLEQQEKNWKTKFFVNSSENILEAPPTHPSEYRNQSSSSRGKASPRGGMGSDEVDNGSPSYRTPYQAVESCSKSTNAATATATTNTHAKSICSSSQRSSSSGNSSGNPAAPSVVPPSNARTSIAAALEPKTASSSSHFYRHTQQSPTGNSVLTQKALDAKEREIRDLEAELARLRERIDPGANMNISLRGSRSRDSSSSRAEHQIEARNHHQHARGGSSDANTIPRKHKRDHSADRVASRQNSRHTHYLCRTSHHHIKSPLAPTSFNPQVNTTVAVTRTAGSESDSGISSTNHTPKDYIQLSVQSDLPNTKSGPSQTMKLFTKPTGLATNRLKPSGQKLAHSVLPNNLGEEIELREDQIKFLENEKQRLEDCLSSKDERIRLLESQIAMQQQATSLTLTSGYFERDRNRDTMSSQMTSRSGSYLPHGGINGFSSAVLDHDLIDKQSSQQGHQYVPYQDSYEGTYEEVGNLSSNSRRESHHNMSPPPPPLLLSSFASPNSSANTASVSSAHRKQSSHTGATDSLAIKGASQFSPNASNPSSRSFEAHSGGSNSSHVQVTCTTYMTQKSSKKQNQRASENNVANLTNGGPKNASSLLRNRDSQTSSDSTVSPTMDLYAYNEEFRHHSPHPLFNTRMNQSETINDDGSNSPSTNQNSLPPSVVTDTSQSSESNQQSSYWSSSRNSAFSRTSSRPFQDNPSQSNFVQFDEPDSKISNIPVNES